MATIHRMIVTALVAALLTTGAAQSPCPKMKDTDGNVYPTVHIGSQCWTAEHLRTTHDRNGNAIAAGNGKSADTPLRYAPNNDPAQVNTYGYLYNFAAALNACPYGWHLPSDAEWSQLTDCVSGQPSCQCGNTESHVAKALASTKGWDSCDVECTPGNTPQQNNSTGFSVLPAGGYGNSFYSFGNGSAIWSSTELDDSRAWKRYIDYNLPHVGRSNYLKEGGFSVRCVKD
ncbi:MAG: fibrobacter succinogenes major paralogous domain-containing protein [Bacteroidales bacterium]|nr:fibrobacter succinogenes major paralogous domain-containing protein [Bacteroidales bacterium]